MKNIDILKRRHAQTIPENNHLVIEATEVRPEFVRLPKPGKRCYWTGLTRSGMNELVLGENPEVASMVLARSGTGRGVRLVHLPSLLDYLHRKLAEQHDGESDSGKEVSHD